MPLALPPPGVTANFDHPAVNTWHVSITAAICIPLIVIFSLLRLYTQQYIYPSRTKADYTFMLAALWTIIYIGLLLALLDKGLFGRHIWELKLKDLTNTPFLLVLILEAIYGPFIWIIKLSLFFLYRQIFAPKQYLQYLIWGGIAVTGLFYWSSTVIAVALCAPRGNETYIMAFATARCGATKQLAVASGVFNVLSDLYLLVIPVPATLALHLPRRKKIGLLILFATGILAAVVAYFGRSHNENNDTEQGTFYQMTKLRNVVTHPNNQDIEFLSSDRHGHRATSSSDSAMQLRTDTSDSVTLTEQPSRACGPPKT
ncbi:MAG: hypothetical protein Q9209_006529 [Squamulea sp. 1 TL-2023]